MYGRQKVLQVIKTLQTLVAEDQSPSLIKDVQRYSYSEIRKFLQVSSGNHQIAAKKIISNMSWRNKNIPVKESDLVGIMNSGQVTLSGIDRELCPCLYIRPNFTHKRGLSFVNPISKHSY